MAESVSVWGIVAKDGSILSGTGFKVDRVGTGVYTVLFDRTFVGVPSVVTTQVYPNDTSSTGGDVLDNSVVVGISSDRFRSITGSSANVKADRDFSFIAIGH
ncbi:hypothetical protein [Streptomyces sp. NPDC088350]|uniref:hypothetical protein n=1 Tax=Streptomyces sp. NPDC088350 TaxID=3365854 RepID=UPI0037FF644C